MHLYNLEVPISFNFFQYLELYKVKDEEIKMTNFALIMCEIQGPNFLSIRLAIDLSAATFGEGKHYALISSSSDMTSLIPNFPNTDFWRFFGDVPNQDTWLQVKNENILVIFLLYNDGSKNLFDVFTKTNKQKSFALNNEKLAFVKTYVTGKNSICLSHL